MHAATYDQSHIVGRALTAFLDVATIALTFALGAMLWNEWVGLLGAFLYSVMPLAIQYAHFMVMESWVVFFWMLTILALVWWKKFPFQIRRISLVGIALGCAVASKASSLLLAGLVIVNGAVLSLPVAALVFRFFQPTIFSSPSWTDWSIRPDFLRPFEFQQAAIDGKVMFPPQWQWVHTTPWIFPFKNLFWWGVGPVTMTLALIGLGLLVLTAVRTRSWFLFTMWSFMIGSFFWQGGKFVKTLRYFLPFFPLYALLAAWTIWSIHRSRPRVGRFLSCVTIAIGLSFAVLFTSVYRTPQTRVTASRWIYDHIPRGTTIALEEWDDPLPLSLPQGDVSQYNTFQMQVYAPDDENKQKLFDEWLQKSDWIVLSSRRAKGSVGKLPTEFPLTSRFYRNLDNGSLGFVKVVEFTSFPSFTIGTIKFQLDDSLAEEAFWVYDHPIVEIYQKKTSSSDRTQ